MTRAGDEHAAVFAQEAPRTVRGALGWRLQLCSGPLLVLGLATALGVVIGAAIAAGPRTAPGAVSSLLCAASFFLAPLLVWVGAALRGAGRWLAHGPSVTWTVEHVGPEEAMSAAQGGRVSARRLVLTSAAAEGAATFVVPVGTGWAPEPGARVRSIQHPRKPSLYLFEPLPRRPFQRLA